MPRDVMLRNYNIIRISNKESNQSYQYLIAMPFKILPDHEWCIPEYGEWHYCRQHCSNYVALSASLE
jgi:hypothetical protein